ncbi:hypothetical protein NXX11_04295 [Phocaeicola vulgatus]|nr:hypothetical protein [Phocaeicola vulgatus]MCS2731213.1 hypothetical protein [Phocaeicola vulgatus]
MKKSGTDWQQKDCTSANKSYLNYSRIPFIAAIWHINSCKEILYKGITHH